MNTGDEPDLDRAYPCDPPGTMTAGWRKTDANIDGTGAGGWHAIDEVEGSDDAGWCET